MFVSLLTISLEQPLILLTPNRRWGPFYGNGNRYRRFDDTTEKRLLKFLVTSVVALSKEEFSIGFMVALCLKFIGLARPCRCKSDIK